MVSDLVRQPIRFRPPIDITAFPPFFHPLSRSSFPHHRHPRVVWPGHHRVKGSGREQQPFCPFSQFDGNAKTRFRAFRGGWSAGWLAGTQGDRTGGESELVYGTARLEINVHRYTPSTILLNGGLVEKYFVHAGPSAPSTVYFSIF